MDGNVEVSCRYNEPGSVSAEAETDWEGRRSTGDCVDFFHTSDFQYCYCNIFHRPLLSKKVRKGIIVSLYGGSTMCVQEVSGIPP